MRILISNDDGYQAPGIEALAKAITEVADHIDVIAPERNRSAASSSLTVHDPLRVFKAPNGFLYVNGTPSDCVHLAITGLLDTLPDMVISGINSGSNLGDDVIYSGTVAAAIEGRFLGYPAIAVSMTSYTPQHYDSGARAARELVARIRSTSLPGESILNMNVPDLPWDEIKGWQVTRLGNRHRAEHVIKGHDPRGDQLYWIGAAGSEQDAGPGTDFHAVSNGYISITPLKIDLTRYDHLDSLSRWVKDL
ncbi:MAG: 5'/3'-nucleotidase SurE [Gammaproteobacteria bacterium]|nr:5'/3'-nucleotidase SurE [Gammaproteobacteria bacterium]